jgi:hypothetical protein
MYISFSADPRMWTCAYRTVSSYLKCPSITSEPSIDILRAEESHHCFNRQSPEPAATPETNIELHRYPAEGLAAFSGSVSAAAGGSYATTSIGLRPRRAPLTGFEGGTSDVGNGRPCLFHHTSSR